MLRITRATRMTDFRIDVSHSKGRDIIQCASEEEQKFILRLLSIEIDKNHGLDGMPYH
jgi:hypothetical protein